MTTLNAEFSEDILEKYFQSASQGNLEDLLYYLKSVPHVDVANRRGWTAIMFAAKYGHSNIVKELLKRGCNVLKMNSNGQTAQDIAEFWLHKEVVSQLSSDSPKTEVLIGRSNYFCDNPLDRASYRRTDHSWIDKALHHPKSVFVAFTDLCPLVYADKDDVSPEKCTFKETSVVGYKLVRLDLKRVTKLQTSWEDSVLLGVETSETANFDSSDITFGWFAFETKLDFLEIQKIIPDATKLPFPFGLRNLVRAEASIVSQARSLLAWHDRNQFCPTCGAASKLVDAGYKRECTNKSCRSNNGVHNTCYPRTDPSIIIAISSPDNKMILLGRNKRRSFTNMWSILAGFVEPGENIEEACRREVYEETKIKVGPVIYHSSQPWPMPNTLMIGCLGKALSSSVDVDKTELADARWFDASEIEQMLEEKHPAGFILPPTQAIAHHLILHWLTTINNSRNFDQSQCLFGAIFYP